MTYQQDESQQRFWGCISLALPIVRIRRLSQPIKMLNVRYMPVITMQKTTVRIRISIIIKYTERITNAHQARLSCDFFATEMV